MRKSFLYRESTIENNHFFINSKHWFLINLWSDKPFMCYDVNRPLSSLYGGSLEITLTVPFRDRISRKKQWRSYNVKRKQCLHTIRSGYLYLWAMKQWLTHGKLTHSKLGVGREPPDAMSLGYADIEPRRFARQTEPPLCRQSLELPSNSGKLVSA